MDLLQRFADGDPEAFESLFRQYQADVYRWIVRIVRDPAAAEDLTVETFWRFHNARARIDSNGNCGAWLRRVATNLSIDHLRRAKPVETLLAEPPAPAQCDPAVTEETRRAIRQALGELSPRLRIVIQLALVENESYSCIAEALSISLSAVKVRIHRATRILRKKLAERGVQP
jgi:RNA polymerase sigma-70 factor (ECF subfamily)